MSKKLLLYAAIAVVVVMLIKKRRASAAESAYYAAEGAANDTPYTAPPGTTYGPTADDLTGAAPPVGDVPWSAPAGTTFGPSSAELGIVSDALVSSHARSVGPVYLGPYETGVETLAPASTVNLVTTSSGPVIAMPPDAHEIYVDQYDGPFSLKSDALLGRNNVDLLY